MTEWLNPSVLISSAIGSLFAGLVLLTTKPFWWKCWWKWVNTEAVSKGIKAWLPLMAVLLLFFSPVFYINYVEKSNIPPFHPSLTEEEAAAARAECRMESIKATAALNMYEREHTRVRYYGACLESKGFEWNEPQAVPQ